jgi:DNA-directed RNA polymerase subunit E'/Rpb7
MELTRERRDIDIKVSIPPHKLHIYEEYIGKFLKNIENKPYNNEVGYIYEIYSINDIKPLKINTNGFVGDLIFSVNFTAMCYKPEPNTIIKCQVIQNNNIIFAKNGPLIIVIVEDDNLTEENISTGDIIDVNIMCYEINKEYIKVVSKFVNKDN